MPFTLLPNDENPKYVCFTVSHFSTYGIAEVGGGSNTNSAAKNEGNIDSSAKTGDNYNMMIPAILALAALGVCSAVMVIRRKKA